MSDISSFNFSEAAGAALKDLETVPTPSVDTPSPEAPVATEAPVTETPAQDPTTPDPLRTAKHKVKVRGQEEEVEYDELVKGYSRQADYTRSKQELAEQARAIREMEAQIKGQQQSIEQIFGQDPTLNQAAQVAKAYNVPFSQALQAVIAYQNQQQQQTPPNSPQAEEIVTAQQARQIAEQQIGQLQQQIQLMQQQIQNWTAEQIQGAKQEITTSQKAAAHTQEINATLAEIFERNPILSAVENIEDVLRYKVYQADPATIEEAKDLFAKFATEQVDKLTRQFTEINKAKVTAKEKLVTGGIEPPGGSGITPQPADLKFGSKDLANAATAYIQNLTR